MPLHYCLVHLIFLSFGLWYFGHFRCMIFFPGFFHLAQLALQNVNKDYVIFSYFRNFVTKSYQKPKRKNEINKTYVLTTYMLSKYTKVSWVGVQILDMEGQK